MTMLKHNLATIFAILMMIFAGSFASYAEVAEDAEETVKAASVQNETSKTIVVGEYRRQAQTAEEEAVSEDTAEEEAASEEAPIRSLGMFRTTAYCPCYGCSEGYGRHTSTGAIARANHTIAVDPRVIPYGSKVIINGTVYTAEDRGGGVKGNHIDIFYDTHAQTRKYGSRQVEIFLIS